MKRIFVMAVAILMVITTVVGCSAQTSPPIASAPAATQTPAPSAAASTESATVAPTASPTAPAVDTSATLNIRFLTSMTDDNRTKLLESTEKVFNQKWPNVTFSNESSSDYAQKLKLEFTSGSGPDMCYLDDLNQQTLMQGNYLMDITQDVISRGWIDKELKGAVEYNNLRTPGKYYSVPFLMAPVVIYYNKDIFTKLGLQPPTTMDDLVSIMDKAKEAGYIPMENAGANNYNVLWMVYSIMFGNVPKDDVNKWYYLQGTTDAMKNGFVSAMQTMYDWEKKGYFRPNSAGVTYDQIPNLYAQGKTAMVADGDWNLAQYDQSGVPTGIFSFPNGTNIIVNATDGAWALNAKLDPAKKPACLDFMETFLNPDVVKTWYVGGLTPSVKFDPTGANISQLKMDLNKAIQNTSMGFYLDNAVPGLLDVEVKNSQLVMLGKITPEQCWDAMDASYQSFKNGTTPK